MKSKLSRFTLVIACLAVALSLSACQGFWEAFGAGLFSVTGTAVNVAQPVSSTTAVYKGTKDPTKTLVGASITLTNVYDASKSATATVGPDGTWTASAVSAGTYRITGSATGWTFIPKEVKITGMLQKAEPILAYETPADLNEIMIVVEWKRPTNANAVDVDCILVLDQNNDGTGDSAVYTTAFTYTGASGYTVPALYLGSAIKLDRDVYGADNLSKDATTPLVETIRIKQNPWGTGTGQLRYYLNAFSGTLTGDSTATTPSASTYATVTVMQPTLGLLGIFNIALDSVEQTLGVVKIDVGYSGSTTSYTVKSFGNEGAGVMTSVF